MGVLGAIIGGAASLAGAGIDAKTQKEINAANIRAQQEMNATNIMAAKASQERSRKYALEDREYNSEHSQYQRLLSLGMSPAMAMQAVSGAQSNLSSIDTSMPQQQAYMQQYSPVWASAFGNAGDLLAHSTAALEQKYIQEQAQQNQFEHDEKMFNMQVEEQKRQENQRLIKEKYGYKEYADQNDNITSLFNEIRRYFRDENISMAGMSRDDIETKLQSSNEDLYNKLQSAVSNACANEIFDDLCDRNQSQSLTGLDYTNKDLQNDILELSKQITGLDLYKAGIDAKNYPVLSRLLIQLKKGELKIQNLTIQDMEKEFDLKEASRELEKLKLQYEEKKFRIKNGDYDWGDSVTNTVANRVFEVVQLLGMLIENLGSALSLIKK